MKPEENFGNLKQHFGLFIGEVGILRCKGRLGKAPLDITAGYPILLPRRHHVTRLIVEACHRKGNHGGVKETLIEFRSEYWVPKGRQLVKKTLHQCVICKKLEGLPYKAPWERSYPKQGSLMSLRSCTWELISLAHYLRRPPEVQPKRTSAYLHVLHQERYTWNFSQTSSEAFIRGLQRFDGRRGTPASITSDNAKTFKRANKDFTELFRARKAQDFAANQGITWNFILE